MCYWMCVDHSSLKSLLLIGATTCTGEQGGARRTCTFTQAPTLFKAAVAEYNITGTRFQPSWKLIDRESELLGYRIYKAVVTHEGKSVEAWYAPDLPSPAGLELYGGLPGLILSLSGTVLLTEPLRLHWMKRCESTSKSSQRVFY